MEETMNRFAFAALAAMLVGCPTDDKTDSGTTLTDTDDTDETTDACETTFSGPVTVQTANVTCDASGVVTIDVETQGWTSGGYIYAVDTRNASPWADEHDLDSYEYDPCGTYDKLKVELQTGAALADWERNVSSVFTCDGHYEDGALSYAAAVLDLYGDVADCMAWGEDPQAIIDGTVVGYYNYDNGPASFDPSICVIGAAAR